MFVTLKSFAKFNGRTVTFFLNTYTQIDGKPNFIESYLWNNVLKFAQRGH